MLQQKSDSFGESRESITSQSRTVEILTGIAGVLVTAVVLYLEFLEGAAGF